MYDLPRTPCLFIPEFIRGKYKCCLLFLQEFHFPCQLVRHPDIICIQERNISSLCFCYPGISCPCSTAVLCTPDQTDLLFLLFFKRQLLPPFPYISFDHCPAVVNRTVIDQQKLPVLIGLCFYHAYGFFDIISGIINRYDNTDQILLHTLSFLFYKIDWTIFYLHIRLGKILADNSKAEQLYTADQ